MNEGNVEEFIKRQPEQEITTFLAQILLFQVAYALHIAADRFSVKHYDIKLLNVFLYKRFMEVLAKRFKEVANDDVVMRYDSGSHKFALRVSLQNAFIAKLDDFGTANIDKKANGLQVTKDQFTTIENTPPDFMILGDKAKQGHGRDHFGLGLCMLHLLFTGHAPYGEVLEEAKCPDEFKNHLLRVWKGPGYSVIK